LSCHLNRSAFCPGDNILVTAKCDNNTERDMDELEAKLMQSIKYTASCSDRGTDYRHETKEVAEIECKF